MQQLTLPYPPLVNNLYMTVRRGKGSQRVKTTRARDYKQVVIDACEAARIERVEGEVMLTFLIYRPRMAGDIDGHFKAIMDGLTGFAYKDDKQVKVLVAILEDDKFNPRVELTIEARE